MGVCVNVYTFSLRIVCQSEVYAIAPQKVSVRNTST